MLFRLCLIGPALAAGMFFASLSRADDAALAAIKKAIQFQKEVRAYRIKESMTDVIDGNKVVENTIEVVNPDQLHQREVVNGKLEREWFTDGKRYLIRVSPEAEWKEETDDAASGIKMMQESARLPAPKPEEVQLTGHETIDGEPVSIYTRVSKSGTVTKETLRIADKDNRLLDRSGETKGELRVTDHTIPENFFWHTTYEYDPSIKIALPPTVKSSPTPTATPPQSETDQTPFDVLKTKAEAGDAKSQFLLGRRYHRGEGVTKDLAEAVKWYRKAAEQNFATAQNNLGYCYENGEGVAKDQVEAAKWYRKAAEQNDDLAQLNLGRCYARAGGVPKDLVEAYKWFLLASEQGNDRARELIVLMAKQMSADQVDEAQKRARDFSPKPATTREVPHPTDPRAERIRALAAESNAALLSGNYARVADLVYPKVVEMMGGREKVIETTRQSIEDLKDHGVSIVSIDVTEPERIVAANNKLFAVVPQLVRMENSKKKGHTRGFLVAVSEDAGKNWTFVDGAGLEDPEALARILPDFPAELSLPKKAPPVFEPK